MAQSAKICRHRENLISKIAKFEWFVEVEPRYTCSSAESKNFTDVCMMGDDTNVCKMLRLWGVISMLALDLLLSNLASVLMLRRSFQRCWLIFADPHQNHSNGKVIGACFYCHFFALLHFDWFKNRAKSCHLSSQLGKTRLNVACSYVSCAFSYIQPRTRGFLSFFYLSSDWSIGLSLFAVIG